MSEPTTEPGALTTLDPARKVTGYLPDLPRQEVFSLTPRNLEEAFKLADVLAQSELVPKDYRGKPANVLVAVQHGGEIGLKPMQALASIAVVNGRASLWGDGMLALVLADPRCEYVHETEDAAGTAICQAKRRGQKEQVRTFSIEDAKTAKLFGKDGPWQTSPKRMRQLRARAFALRDVFADVLRGLPMAEEVQDLPASEPTPLSQVPGAAPDVPPELLADAQRAAAQGWSTLAAWVKDITEDQRRLLQHQLEALKAKAAEVTRAERAAAEEKATAERLAAAGDQTERVKDSFVADMDAADKAAGRA